MQKELLSSSKRFDVNNRWEGSFNSADWSGVVVLTRSADCHPAEHHMHVSFSEQPQCTMVWLNIRADMTLDRENVRLYLPLDEVLHHRALVLIHDDSEALNLFDIGHLT